MANFKEISISEARDIVREADLEKTFLPSISAPNFTVENFLAQGEPGYRIFGSLDDNSKIIGFITLKTDKEKVVNIGPMYVAKDSRNIGLGKWQVEKVIEWANNQGMKGIFTKTWGKNVASRKIFDELGFKLKEEKPNARVNGDSTVKYYLDLS